MTLADIRVLRCDENKINEIINILPPEFVNFYKNLCKLEFEAKPDYDDFQLCLRIAWEREHIRS